MKAFSSAFIVLFSLLLLVSLIHARKDPAGDYWKKVMKDQPIPEAIKNLMVHPENRSNIRPFLKEFDVRPNVIIYHTHADPKELKWGLDHVPSAENKPGPGGS
ncbi:hypothetical protein SAY86_031121 [Trapa natans]|uniref:Organ specific protein n=1 Tax=Trapa natans TaxID=22666 RepID=A0AAN7M3Z7_TRANT|nr:hypothetical protein SAY86_031121 [Trapa natans]